MSSTRGVRFQYRTGESVLCFEPDSTKAKVLYDAKVLDISVTHDKTGRRQPAYLIHFLRWNSSWDRVVPESYLLKNTDDNRVLMRKLTLIAQKECGRRRNKARSRKIERALKRHFDKMSSPNRPRDIVGSELSSDDDDQEDSDDSDDETDAHDLLDEKDDDDDDAEMYASETHDEDQPISEDSDDELEMACEPVKLDIPPVLRQVLQRDRHLVRVKHTLLQLPASPTVVNILESYVKSYAVNAATSSCFDRPTRLTRSGDDDRQMAALENNVRLRQEVVDGLRVMFDFTLPLILLYNSEHAQYQQLTKPEPIKLKLELAGTEESARVSKSTSRPRHHVSKTEETHEDTDSEVIVKTDAVMSQSPRGRQSSPRRAVQKRNKPTSADVQRPAIHSDLRGPDRKRNRRSSTDRRHAQKDVHSHSSMVHSHSSMPPPLLAAVHSATSSSRTSSPERPLPHLTAAVIPHHQLDLGFPEHPNVKILK